MANIKFSQFTTNAGIDGNPPAAAGSGNSFLVGFDTTANSNNRWSFPQIAAGLSVHMPTIYSFNGTIGTNRVATITDFPKFSGDEGNPIGLEIENSRGGTNQSTHGAQLKLTARAGASSTISFYNGQGGGSSAPAMVIDSPAGIRYTGGSTYTNYHHSFNRSGSQPWYIGMTNSPLAANSPKLEMLLGGGGSNASFYTTKINGSSDFLYMFMSPGTTARHIALGEYTNSTTTYKDFLRINSIGDIGINQDTPTEKLHVTGNIKVEGQAYSGLETGVGIDSIDFNDGNVQEVTLVASTETDFDPTNFKAGATYILKLTQPTGGNATIAWESTVNAVNWPGGTPPTLSTAAGAVDIVTLICTSEASNGTFYANATLNFS